MTRIKLTMTRIKLTIEISGDDDKVVTDFSEIRRTYSCSKEDLCKYVDTLITSFLTGEPAKDFINVESKE